MIVLRLPGALRYRDLAMRVVGSACKLVGAAGEQRTRDFDDQVVSAFGEAFNNAALHSYKEGQQGELEIILDVDSQSITIRMIDFGDGFDFDRVAEPDLDSLPESGLGIFIIKSFMDEVTYVAGTPNTLSMTKRLVA